MLGFFSMLAFPGKAEGCPQIGKGEIWRCFCIQNHRNTKVPERFNASRTREPLFEWHGIVRNTYKNSYIFFRGLTSFVPLLFLATAPPWHFPKRIILLYSQCNLVSELKSQSPGGDAFARELSTNNADKRNEQCL